MPVLTINGYAHNYEEVGSGTPLVFLACTRFDSAKAWVGHMSEHAAGFRVILPDLRGMAGSAHTTDVAPADWVDDLRALLDALSLPAVHLCAETLGTRVATRFAAEHPDRVTTLILNGTIAYSYAGGDADRLRNSDLANMPQDRKESLQYHHGDDWPSVNTFYLAMHGRDDFHSYYDLRQVAERVKAPTLLLRWDIDDQLHPVAHSVELHQRIPTSWLAIYPNTPFNAMRSKPQEVWSLIRTFVQENASRA